jgi:hypothetical protein
MPWRNPMTPKRKSASEKYVVVTEQPRPVRIAVAAFLAGAALMWLVMHFLVGPSAPKASSASAGAPDVSQLPPAQAAATLGNWESDHRNWPAAIQQYERAIAAGLDTADLRTDLGTAYNYFGDGNKALEEYGVAQRKDPFHQNSLFNQAIVYAHTLKDKPRALAAAREFLRRFPQSQGAATARKMVSDLEAEQTALEKELGSFLTTPTPTPAKPPP